MLSTSFKKVLRRNRVIFRYEDTAEKSRERNREHAKKTRLRKKALLEGMKARLLYLQNEVITSISWKIVS